MPSIKKPSVAVIGASPDRQKFGNRAVRAFASRGYDVFPIHPSAKTIEGHQAYPSVLDVPVDQLDRVTFYVPPEIGLLVIEEVARKPVGEVWLNPGAENPALIARARALGLNLVVGCSIIAIGADPHDLVG